MLSFCVFYMSVSGLLLFLFCFVFTWEPFFLLHLKLLKGREHAAVCVSTGYLVQSFPAWPVLHSCYSANSWDYCYRFWVLGAAINRDTFAWEMSGTYFSCHFLFPLLKSNVSQNSFIFFSFSSKNISVLSFATLNRKFNKPFRGETDHLQVFEVESLN